MDKILINIRGKEYPCRLSYKAFKEFESLFKPISLIKQTVEDTAKLFYCGIKAGSLSEKIKFSMGWPQFEDWLDENMDALGQFQTMQNTVDKEADKSPNAESPLV